ncbi:MAG: hypothetical protein Fur0021_19690 [Candidatus Promineifilaceae bacterium]
MEIEITLKAHLDEVKQMLNTPNNRLPHEVGALFSEWYEIVNKQVWFSGSLEKVISGEKALELYEKYWSLADPKNKNFWFKREEIRRLLKYAELAISQLLIAIEQAKDAGMKDEIVYFSDQVDGPDHDQRKKYN